MRTIKTSKLNTEPFKVLFTSSLHYRNLLVLIIAIGRLVNIFFV